MQLIKVDGFHLGTFLGSAAYSVLDRFKHFGDYMLMTTSKMGYVTGYGFALYNVGWTIGAMASDDYEWIADFRDMNYIRKSSLMYNDCCGKVSEKI